jgi:hypothetical protein
MILEKLEGKKYCFVAQNYGFIEEGALSVRADQYLTNGRDGTPMSVYFDKKENAYAGFNFFDSYGVWGCSTSKHDKELKYGWDSNFDAPYIVIDYAQIKIVHRAPAGHILVWVLAIQD